MTADITLNKTCHIASCFLTEEPPREPRTAVNVVPMFAPITMATDSGKPITPALIAASVSTHTAVLELRMIVTTIPTMKNAGSHKCT